MITCREISNGGEERRARIWTREEAEADALARHPECTFARVEYGLSAWLEITWVVNIWRNEECWLAQDPMKFVEQGYPQDRGIA